MKPNKELAAKIAASKDRNKARNDRKHHIKIELETQFEALNKEWDGFSVEEKNVLRYKRKWQKFLRWKTRNKRHFSKKNPSQAPVVEKKYNLYVSYDQHLTDQVKNALKDVKKESWFKNPNIITDIYFYVKDVDKETVEKFKELFSSVTCTVKNKTYYVRLQAIVAKKMTEMSTKKKVRNKKPTNNTTERKLRAKVVRKLKNLRYFDILEALEKGNMSLKDAASWAIGKNHKMNLEKKKSQKLPRKLKKSAKQSKPSPVGKKPLSVAKKAHIEANLKPNIKPRVTLKDIKKAA